MQNPDRCNGRGFLFLQSVSAIQGSPELHRSACGWYQQLQARPLPCCGLIFTGGVKSSSNSRAFPHGSDKAKQRYCGRYRRRCQTLHQNQTRKRNEMPDFPIGNYAFFGVGEPAACGAGGRHSTFCRRRLLQRISPPSARRCREGEGATQPDADTPLSCDVCAWLWYCVITSSAIPHGYTP